MGMIGNNAAAGELRRMVRALAEIDTLLEAGDIEGARATIAKARGTA